jgi:hypothetical protein
MEDEAQHLYTNLGPGEVSMLMSELALLLVSWKLGLESWIALRIACQDITPHCYCR